MTALLENPAGAEPVETEPETRSRLLDDVFGRFEKGGIGVDTSQILTREDFTTEMRLADTNVLIYPEKRRE